MKKHLITLAACLAASLPAWSADAAYQFGGTVYLAGQRLGYTGEVVFDADPARYGTVYFSDQTPQQGFRTTYQGATRSLVLHVQGGETVVSQPGAVWFNNIAQMEPGAQVPEGVSMQAWTGGTSGSIAGVALHNAYLAFLPVPFDDPWDRLAPLGLTEAALNANPALLPAGIDPTLTGTAWSARTLDSTFSNGVFLGINYGPTNQVVAIDWFAPLAPVPDPAAAGLLAAGLLVLALQAAGRKPSIDR